MQAYDADWRHTQLQTIGGSSAAAVVGKSRFTSQAELWERMKGVLVDDELPPEKQETDDMRRGRVFEPIARDLLCERLGSRIVPHDQCDFTVNEDLPWAHCLTDGRVERGAWDEIVEIKCPRPGTIARCNLEGLLSEWWLQAQHNMMVTNTTVCHLAMLDTMSAILHYMPIALDQVAASELMIHERDFFESIKGGRPPQGEEAQAKASDGPTTQVFETAEIAAAAQTFFRLREIKADAAETLDIAKARLIALTNTDGRPAEAFDVRDPDGGPVGRFYNRLAKPRRTFQHAVAVKEFPALKADKYWKVAKGSRPFKGYPWGD